MNITELYTVGKNSNIKIVTFNLPETDSQCIMDDVGDCYIAIDPDRLTDTQEKVCLAHELGHCFKGAFYNRYSKLDIISRHEYRADKWAIQHVIERVELETAIEHGNTELWQLAEYFDVTEEFMQKAVDYYENERLAVI